MNIKAQVSRSYASTATLPYGWRTQRDKAAALRHAGRLCDLPT